MHTILVVEDEAIVASDLESTLRALGYGVTGTVDRGERALELVAHELPSLVLMDIKLKGPMDGIEAAQLLRERHDVAIVFLTSHSDEATLARATKVHPQGYLLKPFDDHDLRTTIELALNKHVFEKALARRERWFATTLESIGDAVLATNPAGEITFVNRVAEHVTGISREQAIGKRIEDVLVLVNDAGEAVPNPLTRAMLGGFSAMLPARTSLVDRSGGSRRLDDVAAPIVDEHGELLGGVMVFRDITERTQLERQLATTERLATVGTLAGGMAHEINNPLAAIVANVAFARDEIKELRAAVADLRAGKTSRETLSPEERIDEVAMALDETLSSADRVRRIVHDLRYLVRAESDPLTAIDLPPALESAITLAASALSDDIKLVRRFGTTPYVTAHEHQIAQVVANLISNAAYELANVVPPRGGQIELRTRTRSDGQAVIEVVDDGPGMPAHVIDRVFEPFFTTKPLGAGTGLGLPMARGIVVSLGGVIEVESKLGRGSTFRIVLPPAAALGSAHTDTATTVGRARVLVIDDDAALAQATRRVLSRDHDVTMDTRAKEALDRIRLGERYDVIFCDVMMPDMDGIAFLEALGSFWPEGVTRTVLVTGGTLSARAEALIEDKGCVTLSKPAMPETLRKIASDFVRRRHDDEAHGA